jgi:colanic acid biosynthesis glycosyl transferase WcaI
MESCMDLVLVTQFFPPETGAGARRIGAMAGALSERLTIRVIGPEPSYPSEDLYAGMDVSSLDARWPFEIVRPTKFHPYRPTQLRRALAEIGMSLRMARPLVGLRFRCVLVSTPSMFLAPITFALARLKGRGFVWDLRDLTWRYVRETGEDGGLTRLLSRILEQVMGFILRRADMVIVTNPGAKSVVVADYRVPAERVRVVTNGVSRAFYDRLDGGSTAVEGKPIVLYLGLLGRNHGVEVLIDVARLVPRASFVIVGDGPKRREIEAKIRRDDPGNIRLEGYCVDPERIVQYYRSATILFNHTLDTPTLTETVLAAKLFEYMAAGKPIVSGGAGVPADFLAGIGCARTVDSGSPRPIAGAINELLENPALRHEMGNRGRVYVKKHAIREDQMAGLAGEIERWLADRAGDAGGE